VSSFFSELISLKKEVYCHGTENASLN